MVQRPGSRRFFASSPLAIEWCFSTFSTPFLVVTPGRFFDFCVRIEANPRIAEQGQAGQHVVHRRSTSESGQPNRESFLKASLTTESYGQLYPTMEANLNRTLAPRIQVTMLLIAAPSPVRMKIDTGLLELPAANNIIGRAGDPSEVQATINLEGFDAQNKGVSRRHVRIRRANDLVLISDMCSANGTRLNGTYLKPGIEYQLHNGDHLKLGNLEVTVLFQEQPSSTTRNGTRLL